MPVSAPRIVLVAALLLSATTRAQQSPEPAQSAPPPRGTVIFERHEATPDQPTPPDAKAAEPAPTTPPDITDTERAALTITAYTLDARITPATSRLAMRAQITVRNTGSVPLAHIALQVSSSLTWESATLITGIRHTLLPLAQHKLETDADHTGAASEAILTLPAPLAPGASIALDTFYSGSITPDATRLTRIGATAADASLADWDAISETSTALRGFGNVLWYPIAAPQLFLGQGAQLFDAIGQARLLGMTTPVSLHVGVEYVGAPPIAAYFCGRRHPLQPVGDDVTGVPGIAAATFATAPLGFRGISLFIVPERETPSPPQSGILRGGQSLLSVATTDPDGFGAELETGLPIVSASADDASVLLADWLGPQPVSQLTIVDHPGQPFEDGPLLVAPFASLAEAEALPALVHSLTHAWVQTGQPWFDEGLAQFFTLLWTERSRGRDAAIAQLNDLVQPLMLAEPVAASGQPLPPEHLQPLTAATGELYYRRKAAAVWMMLRELVGDDALKLTLQTWRTRKPAANAAPTTPEEDALAFEALLEKNWDGVPVETSNGNAEKPRNKDLHWFFADWVLHDRGLPDLSLTDISTRELPAALGRSTGFSVAVTAHNDGAAIADVPLIIRSGSYSTQQRLRIPAYSSVTTRIVVEAPPTEVLLNDGVTPEQRTSTHTRTVNVVRTK